MHTARRVADGVTCGARAKASVGATAEASSWVCVIVLRRVVTGSDGRNGRTAPWEMERWRGEGGGRRWCCTCGWEKRWIINNNVAVGTRLMVEIDG